jgi:hypothetical protein
VQREALDERRQRRPPRIAATLSTDAHWRALFDHAIAVGSYRSVFEINGAV